MRTNYPENDSQFQESVIEKVGGSAETRWELTSDGWTIGCPGTIGIVPKVGMTLRLYGRGLGYPVRGIFVDGVCGRYMTESEQKAEHEEWLRRIERDERAEFEKNRDKLDRQYDALPAIFRKRLDKFRANNADFRWKFESYELFVCEQAVIFAGALKTVDALRAWSDLPWKEQLAQCPGMSDGHSGNTFGMAVRLAADYLTTPEHVEQRHGALAALVGSDEYGCVPKDGAA